MKTKVRLNAFIRSLFFNNLFVTKRYSVSQILKIEIFLVLYSGKISIFVATIMEVVAQLVRASVCGTEGRGFETRLPPILKRLIKFGLFYFCKLFEKD